MLCRPRVPTLPCLRWPFGVRNASGSKRRNKEKGHWNPERLPTSSKYPLSTELSIRPVDADRPVHSVGYFPADTIFSTPWNLFARTQIVSPDLCDDVIKYIGPTLERHKGCDILDLNPGAGLWSRKLHDFLQPRSHVLVDSSPEMWDRWLRPLLEAPGSTYKLIQGDVTKIETITQLVEDGAFPHQQRVQPGEDGCQRPNDSLLVTGSLLWDPKLPGFGFDSMGKQLILQFAERAWSNQLFHVFGPVRSLFWMAHDAKSIIPRSEMQRGKYDLFLDALTTNTEVVTGEHTPRLAGRGTSGRTPQSELESLVGAMRRGRDRGMELPAHRRENVHDFADDIAKLTDGTGVMNSADMLEYLKEQEYSGKSTAGINLESFIESYRVEKELEENPGMFQMERASPGARGRARVTAEGKRVATLRASVTRAKKIASEIEKLTNLGEDIYKLECKIMGLEDGARKKAELAKLPIMEEELAAGVNRLPPAHRSAVLSEIDDRLAIRSPVPRLAWDSRPFEPLIMKPEEVWPPIAVSLVDSTPRPLTSGKTPEWYDWLQDFAVGLFEIPSISVHQALENLQHGASELVAKAPSLTDPKRGGRLSMHNLRVRMLTVEMVEELCQAYREWPFRNPQTNHTRFFRSKVQQHS
ncbi:S-adenosyl-L-methionine-dependent methyltransferase [Lentithecium fluviatile CBS 122367]|uniref:Mitochondrial transcription factor 1 n=1 Tax=Lentithecium fluviatile CBS 122367 TaxID=1168545 RepID=A0A6G1J6B3_9PLEO|nr:S-adenosyl-L-methionine-dependent methyltransferase [Lentithecium fluviatile CBS 122367]